MTDNNSPAADPRIAIVEDEALLALRVKRDLHHMGYTVEGIYDSAEEALKGIDKTMPDLVLMDIRLKGDMKGTEAADLIKTRYNIPVIFMTAHSSGATIELAMRTEPYGYLLKPVQSEKLRIALEIALYRHKKDIEKEQLTQELRRIMSQQAAILENTSVGITLVKDRGFVWVNSRLADMFGYTKKEMEGKSTRLIYPSQEAYETLGQKGYQALERGEMYETEMELIRKDGSVFWAKFYGRAADKTDLSAGCIWVIEDITSRKLIEDANEQMLFQQSKMAAMGEMLSAISHQWRQPLNAIGLLIQSVKDAYEYGELDKDYLDKAVKDTLYQVNFMSTTIEDFRSFINPSMRKAVFDLKTVAGEVLALLSSQMRHNNISYSVVCSVHNKTFLDYKDIEPCEEFTITSFKNAFKQVILNLIVNAKDAIEERKQRGDMDKLAYGHVMFDFKKDGSVILVCISDNGGGIDEEHMDRIFEPHFTTKPEGKGTGIGLYIARNIVQKNLGGRLYAENIENGARFTIELSKTDKDF